MNSPRVGIAVGLLSEANCLFEATRRLPEATRPLVFVSGGDPRRTAEGISQMLRQGVRGLLSFGIAGGLDPARRAGDVVVACAVRLPEGTRIETEPAWRQRAVAAAGRAGAVFQGDLAGAEAPATTAAAKAALYRDTGALAVDMESHVLARAARAVGVPFMALRAVADPAGRSVPRSALVGLGPDGRVRPLAVLARLASRPWELPRLARLAEETAAALRALRRVAAVDPGAVFCLDPGHEVGDVP